MSRDLGPPGKERPGGYQAARPDQKSADTTTNQAQHNAPRCQECGKPLTAPKTVARRMCRSCRRVYIVCNGGAR